MANNPTIVIVPGSWHCPKHYKYLIDGLAKFNYEAVGVTLPSVNSSPPHASWDQDAQAVREVILKSLDNGNDVIAVAHSFGGVAMSEAVKGLGKEAREKQGLKGGVVRLIYMCAMALPEGQTHVGQIQPQTPEEEELERQRQELQAKYGGMRFTEDGAMLLDKDIIRDIFYNRCDPKDVDEAVELLGSFPTGPLTVPVTYTAYREIPSTYIVCENDEALALSYQERMIAQGDDVFHVERCQEGHSPFLSNPTFVVEWSPCTFDLVRSHPRVTTRRSRRRYASRANLSGEDDGSTSTVENAGDALQVHAVADQDILASWLNIDFDHCLDETSTPNLYSMEFPDIIADTARPGRHHDEIVTSPVTHGSDTIKRPVLLNSQLSVGSSPSSPVYLLNSKLDAKILEECLARIHDTIVTGWSMAQDISHRMTILGTIRFLDHFSDLYGNRLTVSARRKSDAVLKAVLRAFSLQWLSSADSPTGVQSTTNYNSPIGRDTPRNSPMDAFYDSWFQARSLIKNALSVQSFRVVYAILMFDGISIPAKASGETLVAHEFLDAGLHKLNCLAGLVEQYCLNLGSHSTYGTIMEASLSVVRWCNHVRDIGAALTADHVCKLSDVLGQATSSGYEPTSPYVFDQGFNQDFDNSVPECVLSLPFEEVFNLQNGVSAEASILSYHITPTLVAATFQKAIEAILDMQLYPPCGEGTPKDRSLSPHADSTWKQHIDTIMKGLVSLDATIGGALASGLAIQNLMQIHGDIISDCWSCDFET
ncbi:hypothetical protein OAory_01023860 [Aspergillus oryzae]|uniref:AB hydrolase-1 domain-containing protein n=1 Tax=Aspergillus oryzae TaxID=5062 RepID=A0A1S9DXJ9_ASPOZ|nr:hypothetical protein OAory_01023860 [Aspergillus oryzae]